MSKMGGIPTTFRNAKRPREVGLDPPFSLHLCFPLGQVAIRVNASLRRHSFDL
jgi:hypothetical protein